jgi:hypothetical protein
MLKFLKSYWPKGAQWKSWSLPSKLTAIGTYCTIIAFILAMFDVPVGKFLLSYIISNDVIPEIVISLDYPYKRNDDTVFQDKRNPEIIVTNVGSIVISPIKLRAYFLALSNDFSEVMTYCTVQSNQHEYMIFENELGCGKSIKRKIIGMDSPKFRVLYIFESELFYENGINKRTIEDFYLMDGSTHKWRKLDTDDKEMQQISATISKFREVNDPSVGVKITCPLDGVLVPTVEPGYRFVLNPDGTATIEKETNLNP